MAKNTERSTSLFSNVPKVNTDTKSRPEVKETREVEEFVETKAEEKAVTSSALAAQIQDNLAGKKAGKEKISGYVPADLAAQFKATCKANKNKQSDVIEQLLRFYVGNDNK